MKPIIYLIMGILLLSPVLATINCDYSSTPYIRLTEKIEWVCDVDILKEVNESNEVHCISYVRDGQEYFQVNPFQETIDQYGVIDTFESQYGMVNVYFTKNKLRDNKTVTFGVVCLNETFEANITPRYTDFTQTFDRLIWSRDNASYFVAIFILLIILAMGAGYLITNLRGN